MADDDRTKRNGEDRPAFIAESESKPWEGDGLSDREKFEMIRRRYNALCTAANRQNAYVERILAQNSRLGQDVLRMGAELQGAQATAQALGAEINKAGAAANEEVVRLRAILKKHGIKIED